MLAPQTFVRRPDGSYLLSEHLVVAAGRHLEPHGARRPPTCCWPATPRVSCPSSTTAAGLNIAGDESDPAIDRAASTGPARRSDRLTDDGRAYLRSIGGQVSIVDAEISYLGFWSGRTGGLSLTGTDRPDSGALYDLADSLKVRARLPRSRRSTPTRTRPSATYFRPATCRSRPWTSTHRPSATSSAAITATTVSAQRLRPVRLGRQRAGRPVLVVRRQPRRRGWSCTASSSTRCSSGPRRRATRGDGVMLARATTGIVLSEVVASENGRNGVTISGLPLATGPSATGTSVGSYGNNTISNSEITDNGRYGVEVIGGTQHRRPGQRRLAATRWASWCATSPGRSASSATR